MPGTMLAIKWMGRLFIERLAWCLFVCSCSSEIDLQAINPNIIRDSTGAIFGWVCSRNSCKIETVASTPATPLCLGESGYYVYRGYRFIDISVDWECAQGPNPLCEAGPGFGRLVVCNRDSDCPQFERFSYRCYHSVCQDESKQPERIDYEAALALCLWDVPRPSYCTGSLPSLPVIQTSLTSACSGRTDCALPLPSTCHQP